MRRNRAAFVGLAGILASLLAGLAATGYLAWHEGRARCEADAGAVSARDATRRARIAEEAAGRGAYLAGLSAAQAVLREHDVSRAARQLGLAPGVLCGWERKADLARGQRRERFQRDRGLAGGPSYGLGCRPSGC